MTQKAEHKGAGHRKRLRERFLSAGLDGFHDYEVVELLLTLATPRKDCKDVAKTLLKRFDTLQGVLEASSEELTQVRGVGPVNLFGIKFIKAVAERYLKKKIIGKDAVRNSRDLLDYLHLNMQDKDRELFLVVFLNAKNRILACETLFEGSLTSSSVYPREVIKAAIGRQAAALIFVHNHPSGDPDPSPEDIAITRRLCFACNAIGITVHEHLVIGDSRHYSFADHGYIAEFNREYGRQIQSSSNG
jgi:DNA repair protein RadC